VLQRALCYVCWRMLTYADVCWRMLRAPRLPQSFPSTTVLAFLVLVQTYKYWRKLLCWGAPRLRMLAYADVCWRMLTYADVCWRMLTYAEVCWRMLRSSPTTTVLYADDVCWRMLTYADACWGAPRLPQSFPSTTVLAFPVVKYLLCRRWLGTCRLRPSERCY
jgi:hypothetical protein